jgi:hypothetical protein
MAHFHIDLLMNEVKNTSAETERAHGRCVCTQVWRHQSDRIGELGRIAEEERDEEG